MRNRKQQADQLLQLIDHVYEAALDEGRWSRLAPQIAETLASTSTTLQIQRVNDSSHILSMTDNVNARIDDYRAHYWQRDIWVERAVQLIGMSRVGSSRDMVSDAEFEETEFYRDWCRHLDVFFVVGAVFPSGPDELGVLGIHRPRSAGAYDEEDKALVSRFMPHLQRALRVRAHLLQESAYRPTTFEGLDRSETAALLIAADGRVLYANPHADALLVAGKALCYRNGRLAGVRDTENARLHELIGEATRLGGGRPCDGIMTLQRLNQRPLSVLVAPFRTARAGYPAPGAIVLIRDPDRSISAIAALRTLFRFTPTEARIAQALANGKTLAQIAAAHRATLQTVRKQLKIILAKTGTNRQAQCVGVILRSVATLARE